MPGIEQVVSKGFLASGAGAYSVGQAVQLVAGPGGIADQPVQIQLPAATAGLKCIGIAMENMDATKVATGKVFLNVAISGICKGIADGAISIMAVVWTSGTTAGSLTSATQTTGGSQPKFAIGYALSA